MRVLQALAWAQDSPRPRIALLVAPRHAVMVGQTVSSAGLAIIPLALLKPPQGDPLAASPGTACRAEFTPLEPLSVYW